MREREKGRNKSPLSNQQTENNELQEILIYREKLARHLDYYSTLLKFEYKGTQKPFTETRTVSLYLRQQSTLIMSLSRRVKKYESFEN